MEKGREFQNIATVSEITQTTTSLTIDLTLIRKFIITLQSNLSSITVNNIQKGERYDFVFIQDATGGRTVTFPTELQFHGSINTTADSVTVYSGTSYSTSYIKGSVEGDVPDGSVTNAKLAAEVETRISDLETDLPTKADAISEGNHLETDPGISFAVNSQLYIVSTQPRSFNAPAGLTEANPIGTLVYDATGGDPTFNGVTIPYPLVKDVNNKMYLKFHRYADGAVRLLNDAGGAGGASYDVTNAELNAMKSKLDLIEAEAKDDQTAIEIAALLDAYLGTGWREANGDFLPTAGPVSISSENQVGQSIDLTYTYYDEDGDLEDTTDTASGSEYDIRRYVDASAANADSDKTGGTSVGTGRTQGSPVNDVYTLQAGDVDSVIMAWVKVKNANGESAWTKSNVSAVITAAPPATTVNVNFMRFGAGNTGSTEWNDVDVDPSVVATIVADLEDDANAATGIALAITDAFDGSDNNGGPTPGVVGIPDVAFDRGMGIAYWGGTPTAQLRLSGFTSGQSVTIEPFGWNCQGVIEIVGTTTETITVNTATEVAGDARTVQADASGYVFIDCTPSATNGNRIDLAGFILTF